MRRAQNADNHTLKQPRLSQNSSLRAPVLCWLSHLTCISSLKVKNVDFHTAKNIQIQRTLFSLFFGEFLQSRLRPIYCVVWPLREPNRSQPTACRSVHGLQSPRITSTQPEDIKVLLHIPNCLCFCRERNSYHTFWTQQQQWLSSYFEGQRVCFFHLNFSFSFGRFGKHATLCKCLRFFVLSVINLTGVRA